MSYFLTIFAIAALTAPCFGFAQEAMNTSKTEYEVLVGAQRTSVALNQLRAGLHSADPSVRAATANEMITSRSPLLVAVAIEEGHVSDDPVLRDLSARAAFNELKGFVVEPDCTHSLCAPKIITEIAGVAGLSPKVDRYTWESGTFTLLDGQGQISGSQLTFKARLCSGSFTAVPGSWIYSGWTVCASGTHSIRMPMQVRIR